MNLHHHLLAPAIAGVVSGFLVSVPVGPVNVTVINEALTRGFLRPFLIGVGAVTAEAMYCGLALAGFQSVLDQPTIRAALVLLSFLVTTILGFKYLLTEEHFGDRTAIRVEHELEAKLHLRRGYLLGFGMTLANPFIVLVWGMTAAVLTKYGLVHSNLLSQGEFLGGMVAGSSLWFLALASITSRGHKRISPATLRLLTRISGAFLLGVGIWLGKDLVHAVAGSKLILHMH